MSSRVVIGSYNDNVVDSISDSEHVQFIDVAGSPRVKVTPEGWLEISFDSGVGRVCVTPVAGNVVQVYLRS
jgi:hypothetical protein